MSEKPKIGSEKKYNQKMYLVKTGESLNSIAHKIAKTLPEINQKEVIKFILEKNKNNPYLSFFYRRIRGYSPIQGIKRKIRKKEGKVLVWYTLFPNDKIIIPSKKEFASQKRVSIKEKYLKRKENLFLKTRKLLNVFKFFKLMSVKEFKAVPKEYKKFFSKILSIADCNSHKCNLLKRYDSVEILKSYLLIDDHYKDMRTIRAKLVGDHIFFSYVSKGKKHSFSYKLRKKVFSKENKALYTKKNNLKRKALKKAVKTAISYATQDLENLEAFVASYITDPSSKEELNSFIKGLKSSELLNLKHGERPDDTSPEEIKEYIAKFKQKIEKALKKHLLLKGIINSIEKNLIKLVKKELAFFYPSKEPPPSKKN